MGRRGSKADLRHKRVRSILADASPRDRRGATPRPPVPKTTPPKPEASARYAARGRKNPPGHLWLRPRRPVPITEAFTASNRRTLQGRHPPNPESHERPQQAPEASAFSPSARRTHQAAEGQSSQGITRVQVTDPCVILVWLLRLNLSGMVKPARGQKPPPT